MKDFFISSWDDNEKKVKNILSKIYERTNSNKQSRLFLLCAEEYSFQHIGKFTLNDFIFDSNLVETCLLLGATKQIEFKCLSKKKNFKVVLWPNFWIYKSVSEVDIKNLKQNKNIQNLYICLNRVAHSHRIKTLQQLKQHSILNDGIISWHNAEPNELTSATEILNTDQIKLKSEENLEEFYQHVIPSECNNCLINLITESTTDSKVIDISEKTINAIISEMPFIIVGTPYVHQTLKNWGFELYTEIFDYEFDSFLSEEKRIENIVIQLKKLKNKYSCLQQLHSLLRSKTKQNKNRLIEIIKNEELIPKEARKYSHYARIIESAKNNLNYIKGEQK